MVTERTPVLPLEGAQRRGFPERGKRPREPSISYSASRATTQRTTNRRKRTQNSPTPNANARRCFFVPLIPGRPFLFFSSAPCVSRRWACGGLRRRSRRWAQLPVHHKLVQGPSEASPKAVQGGPPRPAGQCLLPRANGRSRRDTIAVVGVSGMTVLCTRKKGLQTPHPRDARRARRHLGIHNTLFASAGRGGGGRRGGLDWPVCSCIAA